VRLAPLGPYDIRPGLAAFVAESQLYQAIADGVVTVTTPVDPTYTPKPYRPMICIYVLPGIYSEWVAISTQPKDHRMLIPARWRDGGPSGWRTKNHWLMSPERRFLGSPRVFAELAAPSRQPYACVTDKALEFIKERVRELTRR